MLIFVIYLVICVFALAIAGVACWLWTKAADWLKRNRPMATRSLTPPRKRRDIERETLLKYQRMQDLH